MAGISKPSNIYSDIIEQVARHLMVAKVEKVEKLNTVWIFT